MKRRPVISRPELRTATPEELREFEYAVLGRISAAGNPVGWVRAGRDSRGYARLAATHAQHISEMLITPEGLIYSTVRRPNG